jgi:hypothetical protein
MCGDKIVELLDVVAFQRFEYDLAFACITSINQDGFAVRGDNKNGISINWSNVENVNLKLPA